MTILITRPIDGAKRTELRFKAAGFKTCIDPVLTIEYIPVNIDLSRYDAIIVTSMHAIDLVARLTINRDLPLFCAGKLSADFAREHGFTPVFYPDQAGAKGLIPIIQKSPYTRFAYIHGETIKIDMKHALSRDEELIINSYCAYKTIPTTAWNDETIALFFAHKITAITFYSEHSARVTLDLIQKHNLSSFTSTIVALCLSETIAEVISGVLWQEIINYQQALAGGS